MASDHRQESAEQSILALQSTIREKDKTIQQLDSEIRRLNRSLDATKAQVAELQGGLTFRLLARYHQMVDRLLPMETGRRHLYNQARGLARTLLLEGPRGLSGVLRSRLQTRPATSYDVIVYQMGKVGSWSVFASLTSLYERRHSSIQVHHVHSLNYLDEFEARVRTQPNVETSLQTIKNYRAIRNRIRNDPEKKWKVITLVREPVGRNAALFFHTLDNLVPDWREGWQKGSLSVEYLQELFLDSKQVSSATPETWFQNQMFAVFGIDVFAEPFPKEQGYKIYAESSRSSLLLIRLENLTECATAAIRSFLDLDDFVLTNSNLGDDKEYASAYRAFRRLPLPRDYVEEMYNTRFARHFYTERELQEFTRNWTAGKSGPQ